MNTISTMTSHQAIMKCPWQWREPFLDEKRESRKRKVGDGYFIDPVDPNFVDYLLPGHAKKFCMNVLETDEKEQIELEIQRLRQKKEQAVYTLDLLQETIEETKEMENMDDFTSCSSSDEEEEEKHRTEIILENKALVDSILQMSRAVEESSVKSSISSPDSSYTSTEEYDLNERLSLLEEEEEISIDTKNISDSFFAMDDTQHISETSTSPHN